MKVNWVIEFLELKMLFLIKFELNKVVNDLPELNSLYYLLILYRLIYWHFHFDFLPIHFIELLPNSSIWKEWQFSQFSLHFVHSSEWFSHTNFGFLHWFSILLEPESIRNYEENKLWRKWAVRKMSYEENDPFSS